MIRIYVALVFLLSHFAVQSQIVIQKRVNFTVKLPKFVDPIITNGFYIQTVEIDSTLGNFIGSVQISATNRRVEAVLEESAEINFLKISNQLVPPSKGAMPVKLIITHIRVDEATTMSSQKGSANLAIKILHKNQSGKELLLFVGDTIAIRPALGDVSKKLGVIIIDALTSLIQEFSLSNWRTHLDSGLLIEDTESYGLSNNAPPYSEPIVDGVYLTPLDLVKRAPSDRTIEVYNRNSKKDYSFKTIYTDKQKFTPFFAVYADSSLYISEAFLNGGQAGKKSVIKMESGIPYYYAEVFATNRGAQQFGLIGGAIGTKKYGVVLDIRSGNIITLIDETIYNLTKENKDLRKYIRENRPLKPIGSRKIVEALNKRFLEAGG